MGKRLLLVTLVLALLLTIFVIPSPVLAKSEAKVSQPQPFAAMADVIVTDPGKSVVIGSDIITRGEIIQGVLTSTVGWDAVAWATLELRHNSVITLAAPVLGPYFGGLVGQFEGTAQALVKVYPQIGGKLTGTYESSLVGQYLITPQGQLVILWVMDTGTFKVAGSIPDADGRSATQTSGEWQAALFLNLVQQTLVGNAWLSGYYTVGP